MAITQRFDTLQGAHTQLASESNRLFINKAAEIANLEQRLAQTLTKQKTDFELLDLKSMKPEKFKGTRSEPWKPWARRFKAYCNGKSLGFRGALDWAEAQQGEIQSFHGCPWDKAEFADEKLHDFLCNTLAGEAVLLVDTPGLETRGFECWRLLSTKYSPNGGQHELDALMSLLAPKPARGLAELGGAISRFEHDWQQYAKLTGETLPEKLKVGALLKILPAQQASEIKWQMAKGLNNYSSMIEHIESYSAHVRHEGAYARGDNDMEISAFTQPDAQDIDTYIPHAPPWEQAAYYQGIAAGYVAENDPAPPSDIAQDPSLDALFRKGKGKGKGKSGKGFGNQGTWSPKGGGRSGGAGGGKGADNPDKDKTCDHCLIKGHTEKDCRGKQSGKPRRPRDAQGRIVREARSFAQEEKPAPVWEREMQEHPGDRGCGGLDRSCGTLDRDCCPVSEEFDLNPDEMLSRSIYEDEASDEEEVPLKSSTSPASLPLTVSPVEQRVLQKGDTITGPSYFSAAFCDDFPGTTEHEGPGPAIRIDPLQTSDPWKQSVPSASVSADNLSNVFAAQNAARVSLNLSELFRQPFISTPAMESTVVLPRADETGMSKLPDSFSLATPSPPRLNMWRKKKQLAHVVSEQLQQRPTTSLLVSEQLQQRPTSRLSLHTSLHTHTQTLILTHMHHTYLHHIAHIHIATCTAQNTHKHTQVKDTADSV